MAVAGQVVRRMSREIELTGEMLRVLLRPLKTGHQMAPNAQAAQRILDRAAGPAGGFSWPAVESAAFGQGSELAISLYCSVVWGQTINVVCDEEGSEQYEVGTQYCGASGCCGPEPLMIEGIELP